MLILSSLSVQTFAAGGWVQAKNNAYFGLSAKSLSVGPSVAIN